jgi:hypothetical protein
VAELWTGRVEGAPPESRDNQDENGARRARFPRTRSNSTVFTECSRTPEDGDFHLAIRHWMTKKSIALALFERPPPS